MTVKKAQVLGSLCEFQVKIYIYKVAHVSRFYLNTHTRWTQHLTFLPCTAPIRANKT